MGTFKSTRTCTIIRVLSKMAYSFDLVIFILVLIAVLILITLEYFSWVLYFGTHPTLVVNSSLTCVTLYTPAAVEGVHLHTTG